MKAILTVICCLSIVYLSNAQSGFSSKSDFTIHNNENGEGLIIQDAYIINGIVKTQHQGNSNKIIFDEGSSWRQENKQGFIDGYVKSNATGSFLFPVGNKGIYRPLGLNNAKETAVVYNHEAPKGASIIKDESIETVTTKEYWKVSSLNTSKVTLTFGEESELNAFTQGELNRLTIMGWNGSGWVRIPSKIDDQGINTAVSSLEESQQDSSFHSGSITTNDEVELHNYTVFTFGVITKTIFDEEQLLAARNAGALKYTHFKSIHFPFNDKELTVYSTRLLHRMIRNLKDKTTQIRLVGHTDYYGSSAYNYNLGMQRAETIKAFFVDKGIVNVNIELLSEGENQPMVDCKNCSSKEMVLNRRVDIYIIN